MFVTTNMGEPAVDAYHLKLWWSNIGKHQKCSKHISKWPGVFVDCSVCWHPIDNHSQNETFNKNTSKSLQWITSTLYIPTLVDGISGIMADYSATHWTSSASRLGFPTFPSRIEAALDRKKHAGYKSGCGMWTCYSSKIRNKYTNKREEICSWFFMYGILQNKSINKYSNRNISILARSVLWDVS